MVIKRKPHFYSNLRVTLTKLDENMILKYPYYSYKSSPKNSQDVRCSPRNIKKETICFFTSEVDLNEAERYDPFIPERTLTCSCGNCSPYYEYKNELRERMMREMQQENFFIPPSVSAESCMLLPPVENDYISPISTEIGVCPTQTTHVSTETQTVPKTYKYTCKVCLSEFNDEYYYEHHRKIHMKALLECPYCNATFVHEKQLQGHVLLHLNKNFYECIHCDIAYADKKYLIRHLKCHEKTFFRCDKCEAQFELKKALEEHEKSHRSTGQLIHVFRNLRSYRRAVDEFVPQQNTISENGRFFNCDRCNLKFVSVKLLNKHKLIHNRAGKMYLFVCTKCKARFRHNGHLQLHEKSAHK